MLLHAVCCWKEGELQMPAACVSVTISPSFCGWMQGLQEVAGPQPKASVCDRPKGSPFTAIAVGRLGSSNVGAETYGLWASRACSLFL